MLAHPPELTPTEQQYLRQRYRYLLGQGEEPSPGKLSPRKVTELDFLAYSVAASDPSITSDNVLEFKARV